MGSGTSRIVGCFAPPNGKNGADLEFLESLDEGFGHSFCYVRPAFLESPVITPSNSERFTVDSSTIDSETLTGSFRQEALEDSSGAHKPNKNFPETTFKTISGASVSANISTVRTGNQLALFTSDFQEPAASFESTSSFAAIPLQPLPRGCGPLNGFMSGPLERGFQSGPLDRGDGFMSGPMKKGVMSGPLDSVDKSNFSAPLARGRSRVGFQHLMRSVSGPMKRTLPKIFSKNPVGTGWMQSFLFHPVTQSAWYPKESKLRAEASRKCLEVGRPSEGEYKRAHNLQWAHGKAGEDRIHVVLSEEQGWLFIGIYDGFSGPDAPDFLMSYLYSAIDKELEGVLWNSEENSQDAPRHEILSSSVANPENWGCTGCPGTAEISAGQFSNREIVEESIKDGKIFGPKPSSEEETSIPSTNASPVPIGNLSDQGRKSIRLYQLLRIEALDERGKAASLSRIGCNYDASLECSSCLRSSVSGEITQDGLPRSSISNTKVNSISHEDQDITASGENGDVRLDSINNIYAKAPCGSDLRHYTKKSLISSKIRKIYWKQKFLRKRFFRWSYDWHREEICINQKIEETPRPMRRCKSDVVDHDAVMRAMTRALQKTEEAYMEMVEKNLERNPELALMGSCVLVMLMKDDDVYVMNLGDSRVILAQERLNDHLSNTNFAKDDQRLTSRSRETLVRMELDRISEESPIHNQNSQINDSNEYKEISHHRLKMKAVQLSTEHTNIEQEVSRIRAEHPEDNQAVSNDRVKGQLKVSRAFGAGFLKRPSFNEALLEMFRVEYVGSGPYLSCIPSILHHRLSATDRFLVLSSDGLYEYFDNEEVIAHVTWFMENVPEGDPAQYLVAELLFRAAKKNGMDFHQLLDVPHGDRRKYHDDVSVMVVSLEGRIWKSSG